MNKNSKIYISGHTGMVGSSIHLNLREKGFTNYVLRTVDELDLTRQKDVENFFEQERPEYVILAAARVGGILANNIYRAQFIYENLMIQNNVIHNSYVHGVKKLLFLGSSCIYPKNSPQPLKEEYLLKGELEYTNEPYAIAKIAGIKMCESYNLQYGTNFISVMPTNLYGPNDNYDLETSHVLPAMIRKMYLAHCLEMINWEFIRKDLDKRPIEGINSNSSIEEIITILSKYGITVDSSTSNLKNSQHDPLVKIPVTLSLWGTGNPRREFVHVDDLADACVFLLASVDINDFIEKRNINNFQLKNTHINIGTGSDISIYNLSELIKKISQFSGHIRWDTTKPDGTFQKLLDVEKITKMGWSSKTKLVDGIQCVYNHYVQCNQHRFS